MKASDAKLLAAKAYKLKETLNREISLIYGDIKSSALKGMVAYHYSRGWLTSDSVDSKFLEQHIVTELVNNGYCVERKYSNQNQPWLLISWS